MKSASLLLLLTTLLLGACEIQIDSDSPEPAAVPAVAEAEDAGIVRPVFPIETDTAYDSSSVPA